MGSSPSTLLQHSPWCGDSRRNTARVCKEREGFSLTLQPSPVSMMQPGLSRQGSDSVGLDTQGLLWSAIRSCCDFLINFGNGSHDKGKNW